MSAVIFLDFDGMLNNHETFLACRGKSREVIDAAAVRLVESLCDRTGAQIVVSSTWRYMGLERLREVLSRHGLTNPELIIDITPDLDHQVAGVWLSPIRGDEIQAWLDAHPEVDHFVILDDDADMGDLASHLVQTTFEHGLLPGHVERAAGVLLQPYVRGTAREAAKA